MTDEPLDMQDKVLVMLMHNPSMSFNALWDKDGRSNKFAYHLKVLETKGLVEKAEGVYRLTLEGKKRVAYIEEQSGEDTEFPIVTVIGLVERGDEYLLLHRAKEPFHGYWGFHGGKLRSKDYILEGAKETIKRDTGLECDVELKGLFSSKTFTNGEFTYNHQLFIVRATNPRGTMLEKTAKGSNVWIKKDEINTLELLPNIPHLIRIATGSGFRWIEADRLHDGGEMRVDVKRDIRF